MDHKSEIIAFGEIPITSLLSFFHIDSTGIPWGKQQKESYIRKPAHLRLEVLVFLRDELLLKKKTFRSKISYSQMSGLFCFIFLLCLSLLRARPVTNPKVVCLVQGLSWLCNYSPCSLFTSRTQKEIELDNGRVSGWRVASNSWPFPSRLSPFRVLTRWWYRRHRVKG